MTLTRAVNIISERARRLGSVPPGPHPRARPPGYNPERPNDDDICPGPGLARVVRCPGPASPESSGSGPARLPPVAAGRRGPLPARGLASPLHSVFLPLTMTQMIFAVLADSEPVSPHWHWAVHYSSTTSSLRRLGPSPVPATDAYNTDACIGPASVCWFRA